MKYIIHVNTTYNNTIINLSNNKGEVLIWASSGNKFKGAKKSTPFAAQISTEKILNYVKKNKIKFLDVIFKGPGVSRDSILRTLNNGGVKILSISDKTSIPHNGCRPPKKRRI